MKLKSLAVATTILSCLFFPATQAAELTYNFDVQFNTGRLEEQTFTGMFSIDDVIVNINQPTVFTPDNGGLFSWMINLNGESFDIINDDGFPQFPAVAFDQGNLESADFLGMSFIGFGSPNGFELNIFSDARVEYTTDGDISSGEIISVIRQNQSMVRTTEPVSIIGLLTVGVSLVLAKPKQSREK